MADELTEHLVAWSYEGVSFPGQDTSTTFGHDAAKHSGFGQRGVDNEDTGRKPLVIRVRAMLINGLRGWTGPALWPDQYTRLVRALEDNPEGILTHPTRGALAVHFDEGTEEIRDPMRRGLTLALNFTEQGGTGELFEFTPATTRDPGTAMLAAAEEADAAKPPAFAAGVSLLDEAAAALDAVEAAGATVAEVVTRLDVLLDAVARCRADPATALVDAHPFRRALYSLESATVRYRAEAAGARRRTLVVPADLSLPRIAGLAEAYGDPTRAADLARANAIADPALVPAGTVLVVVDD